MKKGASCTSTFLGRNTNITRTKSKMAVWERFSRQIKKLLHKMSLKQITKSLRKRDFQKARISSIEFGHFQCEKSKAFDGEG